MPPRGHSSSSHRSSSRSSSSHSRSSSSHRSSSSRSHSSSSHRSSYSKNSRSHSSSSSLGKNTRVRTYASTQKVPIRPRVNQPTNYRSSNGASHMYQCVKHDYIYYPSDWTDEQSGITYKKGYYDEAGNRYEALILQHNGKYENVPLRCPFCDTTLVRDLTDDNQTMECPNCAGNMVIEAVLDTPAAVTFSNGAQFDTSDYTNTAADRASYSIKKSIIQIFVTLFFSAIILFGFFSFAKKIDIYQPQETEYVSESDPNLLLFGSRLYVIVGEDKCTVGHEDDYDKMLLWNYYYESYYDPDSDCYLWYNTDVEPNTWQYWYEGISSDYENSGWMEYDDFDKSWYIETDVGEWEKLDTSKYDMTKVWHF